MLEKSSTLLGSAREAGYTIVHAPISFEKGHHEIAPNTYGILASVKLGGAFTNGEWGSDFVDSMKPQEGDLIVKGKSGLCGFESTNLEFLLRQRDIKNIVLGGFLTNCCLEVSSVDEMIETVWWSRHWQEGMRVDWFLSSLFLICSLPCEVLTRRDTRCTR